MHLIFSAFFNHDFVCNDLLLGLLCHCNTPKCLPENSTCKTNGVCIAAVQKHTNGTLLYSYGLVDKSSSFHLFVRSLSSSFLSDLGTCWSAVMMMTWWQDGWAADVLTLYLFDLHDLCDLVQIEGPSYDTDINHIVEQCITLEVISCCMSPT